MQENRFAKIAAVASKAPRLSWELSGLGGVRQRLGRSLNNSASRWPVTGGSFGPAIPDRHRGKSSGREQSQHHRGRLRHNRVRGNGASENKARVDGQIIRDGRGDGRLDGDRQSQQRQTASQVQRRQVRSSSARRLKRVTADGFAAKDFLKCFAKYYGRGIVVVVGGAGQHKAQITGRNERLISRWSGEWGTRQRRRLSHIHGNVA